MPSLVYNFPQYKLFSVYWKDIPIAQRFRKKNLRINVLGSSFRLTISDNFLCSSLYNADLMLMKSCNECLPNHLPVHINQVKYLIKALLGGALLSTPNTAFAAFIQVFWKRNINILFQYHTLHIPKVWAKLWIPKWMDLVAKAANTYG